MDKMCSFFRLLCDKSKRPKAEFKCLFSLSKSSFSMSHFDENPGSRDFDNPWPIILQNGIYLRGPLRPAKMAKPICGHVGKGPCSHHNLQFTLTRLLAPRFRKGRLNPCRHLELSSTQFVRICSVVNRRRVAVLPVLFWLNNSLAFD